MRLNLIALALTAGLIVSFRQACIAWVSAGFFRQYAFSAAR